MRFTPLLTLLLVAVLALPWASAQAAPVDPSAVRAQLSGFEHVPTAEDWARLGDPADVAAVLLQLAQQPGQGFVRVRAVSSLGHFPRPEVRAALVQLAADRSAPTAIRGKALVAWAYGWRDGAAPAIAPYAADPDPRLREDAVRALRLMTSPAVEAWLRTRVAIEPHATVKSALSDAATQVAGRRAEALRRGQLPQWVIMPRVAP